MNSPLKKAIDRLPDIMLKNAASMMQRMILTTQNNMTQDPALANAAYCALMLKMSAPDLIREFHAAMEQAMQSLKASAGKSGLFSGGLSLSLELETDASADTSVNDLQPASAAFDTLCACARAHQLEVSSAFGPDIFLTVLKDAFAKSRIDSTEAQKIMPYARSALNTELVNLYGKLGAL